ncbi:MAG: hypothetical protein U0869_25475 [Chloroflexota bacterium]
MAYGGRPYRIVAATVSPHGRVQLDLVIPEVHAWLTSIEGEVVDVTFALPARGTSAEDRP